MAGDRTISENYSFSGMHHIFDQHMDAGLSISFQRLTLLIIRADSFPWTAEFHAEPWNSSFFRGFRVSQNIFRISWNLTFFILTTFFTENEFKVALLQVYVNFWIDGDG